MKLRKNPIQGVESLTDSTISLFLEEEIKVDFGEYKYRDICKSLILDFLNKNCDSWRIIKKIWANEPDSPTNYIIGVVGCSFEELYLKLPTIEDEKKYREDPRNLGKLMSELLGNAIQLGFYKTKKPNGLYVRYFYWSKRYGLFRLNYGKY